MSKRRLVSFVGSKYFFYGILIVFLLQALFLAIGVAKNVPPDESYHYGLIKLYSEQAITSGPFLTHQPDSSFFLGDVTRNVSYMYNYLLSFPFRFIDSFTDNVNVQYVSLRFISIFFGVLALVVLRKISLEVTSSRVVANIVTLLTVSTAMFTWLSAAISYDIFALLLFLLTVLYLIRFIKNFKALDYFAAVVWSIFAVQAKITYAPILLFVLAGALVLYFASKPRYRRTYDQFLVQLKQQRYYVATLAVLGTIGIGSLLGGPITNIVKYHSLQPACDTLHTVQQCQKNLIYTRNNIQKQGFEAQKAAGFTIDLRIFDFTGSWVESMYQRLYYFFGHKILYPGHKEELLFVAVLMFVVSLIPFVRRTGRYSKQTLFIACTAILYIVSVYFYNLSTYMDLNAKFAYQGRYLIPGVVLLYILLAMFLREAYRQFSKLTMFHRYYINAGAVAACLLLLLLQPVVIFAMHAGPAWYTSALQTIIDRF